MIELDTEVEQAGVRRRQRRPRQTEGRLGDVPQFEGRTLVAMDCSGSMIGRLMKIGSRFASDLYKANDADLMLFSGEAWYVNPDQTVAPMTLASHIEEVAEWGGTNFRAIFQRARGAYDRVVILSDTQAWMGRQAPRRELDRFAKRSGKRPRIYSFDLAGCGPLQVPEPGVYCLAGVSETAMATVRYLERDGVPPRPRGNTTDL